MGFFAEFSTWLNTLLTTYISDTTTRLADALEPLVVTLGTIYVMVWGFLHVVGKDPRASTGGAQADRDSRGCQRRRHQSVALQ